MKKLNFSAGPSYLHPDILAETQAAIEKQHGLSILEISHRSKIIGDLFEETKHLVKDLLQLQDNKEVLFLHGGASLQYPMIAYNFNTNKKAGIIDTGVWSKKSLLEHQKIRETKLIASGKEQHYNSIPSEYEVDPSLGYVHLTSNNTIYGTQYHQYPKFDCPTVIDMSSDILSRSVDYNQFGLIYAGLQKNLGTAGACLVVVDPEYLDASKDIPSMLDYRIHIKSKSMFNTPPVFAVLMCNITLKWLQKNGGIRTIEQRNKKKAELIYKEIDRNTAFQSSIPKKDRSMMNATFNGLSPKIEAAFTDYAAANAITGINGHRLKGGFRVSLYNAIPVEDVQLMVEHLQLFEKQL